MDIFFAISAFVLGAIIGSFLNVVIYRLHTGKSINGRSHCLSCGATLRWYELIPIVSYMVLRGRCRHCHAHIPLRYSVVELITGLSFLGLWQLYSSEWWLLAFYSAFISVLIVIFVYDLRHTIIPNELVLALGVLSVVYVGVDAYLSKELLGIFWNVLGAVFASLVFAGLWYFSGGRWMGLGDAKLAAPLGLMVGFPAAYTMIVLSFLLGAGISLLILFTQHALKTGTTLLRYSGVPLTMKSEVPFAPFLIGGFVLTQLFHADIFKITFTLLWQL